MGSIFHSVTCFRIVNLVFKWLRHGWHVQHGNTNSHGCSPECSFRSNRSPPEPRWSPGEGLYVSQKDEGQNSGWSCCPQQPAPPRVHGQLLALEIRARRFGVAKQTGTRGGFLPDTQPAPSGSSRPCRAARRAGAAAAWSDPRPPRLDLPPGADGGAWPAHPNVFFFY